MAVPGIHPGEHIVEELTALGMTAAALAERLEVPPNRITEITSAQAGITRDMASRLARFFGTGVEFWSNLQTLYEQRLLEPNGPPKRSSIDAHELRQEPTDLGQWT